MLPSDVGSRISRYIWTQTFPLRCTPTPKYLSCLPKEWGRETASSHTPPPLYPPLPSIVNFLFAYVAPTHCVYAQYLFPSPVGSWECCKKKCWVLSFSESQRLGGLMSCWRNGFVYCLYLITLMWWSAWFLRTRLTLLSCSESLNAESMGKTVTQRHAGNSTESLTSIMCFSWEKHGSPR